MLADFGFAHISGSVRTGEKTGTTFFTAPELLHPIKFGLENGVPSKEGDIYALGMTLYQVLTSCYPFYPRREFEVIHAVIEGARPPKPKNAEEMGMTEPVWELVGECWRENRAERPTMPEILKKFCEITGETKTIDTGAEFAMPRLDTPGKHNSIVSRSPSLATFACEQNCPGLWCKSSLSSN